MSASQMPGSIDWSVKGHGDDGRICRTHCTAMLAMSYTS